MSNLPAVDLLFSLTEKSGKKQRVALLQTQVKQMCSVPYKSIIDKFILNFVLCCVLKEMMVRRTQHTREVR